MMLLTIDTLLWRSPEPLHRGQQKGHSFFGNFKMALCLKFLVQHCPSLSDRKGTAEAKISNYKKMAWLVFPQCIVQCEGNYKVTDHRWRGADTACPSAAPATITAQHNNYVARFIEVISSLDITYIQLYNTVKYVWESIYSSTICPLFFGSMCNIWLCPRSSSVEPRSF